MTQTQVNAMIAEVVLGTRELVADGPRWRTRVPRGEALLPPPPEPAITTRMVRLAMDRLRQGLDAMETHLAAPSASPDLPVLSKPRRSSRRSAPLFTSPSRSGPARRVCRENDTFVREVIDGPGEGAVRWTPGVGARQSGVVLAVAVTATAAGVRMVGRLPAIVPRRIRSDFEAVVRRAESAAAQLRAGVAAGELMFVAEIGEEE